MAGANSPQEKQALLSSPPKGHGGDITPKPDPTALTTASLLREVGSLREIIEARLGGDDRITEFIQKQIDNRQHEINEKVGYLKDLHGEKFRSIEEQFKFLEKFISNQFAERDTRTDKLADATKIAVDAALQAAEKAVNKQNESFADSNKKSEAALIKQLDGIAATIQSSVKATDDKFGQQMMLMQSNQKATEDKFADVKDRIATTDARITTIEGRAVGSDRSVQRSGDMFGYVIGGLGLVATIVTLILLVMRSAKP